MKRPRATAEHPADLARLYRPILWSWPIAVAKRSTAAVDDETQRDESFRIFLEISHLRKWSELSPSLRARGEAAEASSGDGTIEARAVDFRDLLVKAWQSPKRPALRGVCDVCEGAKVSAVRQLALGSNRASSRRAATEARKLRAEAQRSLEALLRSPFHPLAVSPGTRARIREALEALQADPGSGYIEYALTDRRGEGLFGRRFLSSEFSRLGLGGDLSRRAADALAIPRRR